MDIITEEEKLMLDLYTEQVRAFDKAKQGIHNEQAKILEGVFQRFLQNGKWKVKEEGNYYSIEPIDSDTEDLIVNLLSNAFCLSYHDSFHLSNNGVYIDGYVNDGDLHLTVNFFDDLSSDRTRNALKTLKVNFDFGEMIRQAAAEKIVELDKAITSSIQKRDKLIEQLKGM